MKNLLLATAITTAIFGCSEQTADIVQLDSKMIKTAVDPRHGKPGAPVVLRYSLLKNVDINQNNHVEMQFVSDTSQGAMQVELSAQPPLELNSSAQATFTLEQARQSNALTALVSSGIDGKYYLNIQVSETDASGQALMRRAFAIPVSVGSGANTKKAANNYIVEADGSKVIHMPAEESTE